MKHIHFIGIGGTGMNGLAQVYLQLGYAVSGSDKTSSEVTKRLQQLGATIFATHSAENVIGADLVVYSSAIAQDNPELVEAKRKGIPIWHRSELLADLMKTRQVIAVAGTHGKTTTSSMIFSMLHHAGLQPTAVIGGIVQEINSSAILGHGTWLVAETDESDKSFLRLSPKIAVINNIEPDHLEHYDGKFENIITAFKSFMELVPEDGYVIIGYDDITARSLINHSIRPVLTFGLHPNADIHAANIKYQNFGSRFELFYKNEKRAEVQLGMPGKHNIQNALAAIAVGTVLELPLDAILPGLEKFGGVGRRFEVKGTVNGITVVDDYAHNPSKVASAIAAAQTGDANRVIAVFQPHRYTRTKYLANQFCASFDAADELVITSIYPAGEPPIPNISTQTIIDAANQHGYHNITYIPNRDEINDYLIKKIKPGDLVLYMGAGDIWKLAENLVVRLQTEFASKQNINKVSGNLGDGALPILNSKIYRNIPMQDYTSIHIGGNAELFVIVEQPDDLKQIIHYAKSQTIPVFILGGGSNLLVRDGGIRGIVIKLGEGFKKIERVNGNSIRCGAAVCLPDLVNFAANLELSGLETLIGIPGTVGGAIYMNASAFNHSISENIVSVSTLDFDGITQVLSKNEIDFGYHQTNLHNLVILEGVFNLYPDKRSDISARMKEYIERRAATQPLNYPSAGCFFRNPQGEGAGRWIDRAGLKGTKVGNAMISDKHANYVINLGGATASDCLKIINMVQNKVKDAFGIQLEPEVKIVGVNGSL